MGLDVAADSSSNWTGCHESGVEFAAAAGSVDDLIFVDNDDDSF